MIWRIFLKIPYLSHKTKLKRIQYLLETLKFGKKVHTHLGFTFFEYLFIGTKIVPDPDYKPINSAPIQGNDLDFTIGDDFSEDIPEGKNQR